VNDRARNEWAEKDMALSCSFQCDGFVEKAKHWAEDHQIVERLNGDVDGWYPRLGARNVMPVTLGKPRPAG